MIAEPGSILLVCFDGLRRDRATAERMPNLARFMAAGSDMINARSVFPSETRVAATSTVTGCPPGAHGVVANQFIHRRVVADGPFNTANRDNLARADALGLLVDRASLCQRLARAGKRFAVVSTATPGATYMMSYGAKEHDQPVFSVHPGAGTPALMEEAEKRFGPVPAAGKPNSSQVEYAARVLTELVYPQHRPDLAIFWMSDPDITAHGFGIDAPETIAAQRGADEAFARILDCQAAGDGPDNIIVMSDHGHVTGRSRFDLAAALPEYAGQLVPGYFSSLYLPDPTRESVAAAVERLTREPWCGLVFVNLGDEEASVPGALPASAMGGGHPRSAPVTFTLRAEESREPGVPGTCLFVGGISPGGGMHGGLARGELATVLAGAGPAFRTGFSSQTPCWLPDIAPTILQILGLSTEGTRGRVLKEVMPGQDATPPVVLRRHLEASLGDHEQGVWQWLIDGRPVTDFGWSSGPGEHAVMSLRFVLTKLLRAALTLVLAVTFVFVVLRLSGDPVTQMLPDDAPASVITQYREMWGLDRPLPEQYVRYVAGLLRGDFGFSFRDNRPALDVVLERVPLTLELGFTALAITLLLGIGGGILAALKRGTIVDQATMAFTIFGHSMPNFFLGILLILYFAMTLRILPSSGSGSWKHLVLPAITLGTSYAATVARFTRSSLLEVLHQPFMRTAKAKGVPFSRAITEPCPAECRHPDRHRDRPQGRGDLIGAAVVVGAGLRLARRRTAPGQFGRLPRPRRRPDGRAHDRLHDGSRELPGRHRLWLARSADRRTTKGGARMSSTIAPTAVIPRRRRWRLPHGHRPLRPVDCARAGARARRGPDRTLWLRRSEPAEAPEAAGLSRRRPGLSPRHRRPWPRCPLAADLRDADEHPDRLLRHVDRLDHRHAPRLPRGAFPRPRRGGDHAPGRLSGRHALPHHRPRHPRLLRQQLRAVSLRRGLLRLGSLCAPGARHGPAGQRAGLRLRDPDARASIRSGSTCAMSFRTF